ncbi:hypothetical protein [Methanogenium sp. MK-MG]|nr:hypothetical protein [Methanogenium sp. MK-MG]
MHHITGGIQIIFVLSGYRMMKIQRSGLRYSGHSLCADLMAIRKK